MISTIHSSLNAANTISPPQAPQKDHREVRHGETVRDPYFWLREKQNPDVRAYLEAENRWTQEQTGGLKPLSDRLYGEMLGRIKQTDLSVPVRRGEYTYYSRTEEGKQYPIRCRRKGENGAEEVILDPNELGKTHKFVGIGDMEVSDDSRLLAYTVDFTGFRQYDLQVKDLASGSVYSDTIPRVTSVAWANDNQTLLLTTEDAVTKRSDRVYRHRLGNPDFTPVYEEKDELFDVGLHKSRDRSFIYVHSESKDTSEVRLIHADRPNDPLEVFVPRQKGHRYYLDHRGDLFYIQSNFGGAKDFQVVTASFTDREPPQWKPFLPHRPGTRIKHADVFSTFAAVTVQSDAVPNIRIYDFQTSQWSDLPVSEQTYSLSAGENPEYTTDKYRYSYQSMVTPPSIFDFDTKTKKNQLLKRQDVPGNWRQDDYVTERLWTTARDGVRIPISIVYKKGFEPNGQAPLFLYGYGSYGIGTPASFSSDRFSLIDRGIPYAIAHIRGGDEMGEQWREDGMLMKKKNTFQDFVDCAQWLVDHKWTSPAKLMIEGGSAGGLLMGAVVNMRPDLFHAVHLAVPFVDVMNTMMDASLPLTVGEYLEWGNPNEAAAYRYMKTYSPYDNLERRDYPAMLVTSSFNDSQVMYWEPAKYVARLRTLKNNDTPLLLKMKMDPAGHGGASGRYDRLHDRAFEYAWFLQQVGIRQ